MAQSDICGVTVETIPLIDDDRQTVMESVTRLAKQHFAIRNGHVYLRMHPDAFKIFIPNVDQALRPLSNEAQEAVKFICNYDQEPNFLSISYSTVGGDFPCA